MTRSLKSLSLLLSLGVHALLIGGLVLLATYSHNNNLWSGGLGTGAYRVSYINLRLDADGAKGPSPKSSPPQKPPASNSLSALSTPHTAVPADPSPPRQTPSFGTGTSDTPAGGVGAGFGQEGVISETAPNVRAQINKMIRQKLIYPLVAKENGWTGTVRVRLHIENNGTVEEVSVVQGSGYSVLDRSAVATVKKATPLPFYPETILLDIDYQLE